MHQIFIVKLPTTSENLELNYVTTCLEEDKNDPFWLTYKSYGCRSLLSGNTQNKLS